MENLWETLHWAFGLDIDPKDYNLLQISLRATLIYAAGLGILRVSHSRFLGKATAFDIILGFVLGSILSRAINGSSPLFLTIATAALLIFLHWLLATFAFHNDRVGALVKGHPVTLVRDGEIVWDGMRKHRLSRRDLEEAVRLRGSRDDFEGIKEARFERNGDISVVDRKSPPRVVEVRVEEGVQVVRIELG
jgi:uncharacterized membrane protein YcaP (DUF421 family)